MSEKTFVYGGKQFIPVRQFHGKEGDFFAITRRLRTDLELGFFQEDYYGKGSKKQITVMKVFMRPPQIKTVIFSDA